MEFYHRCSESLTVLGKNSEILFTKPCQGSGETERTTQVEPSSTVTTTQVSTLVSSLTTSLRCNFHRKNRKRNYSDTQIQNLISRTHFWLVLWSFLPGVIMTVSCIYMCIARSLNFFGKINRQPPCIICGLFDIVNGRHSYAQQIHLNKRRWSHASLLLWKRSHRWIQEGFTNGLSTNL